jgi:hypothetical protein
MQETHPPGSYLVSSGAKRSKCQMRGSEACLGACCQHFMFRLFVFGFVQTRTRCVYCGIVTSFAHSAVSRHHRTRTSCWRCHATATNLRTSMTQAVWPTRALRFSLSLPPRVMMYPHKAQPAPILRLTSHLCHLLVSLAFLAVQGRIASRISSLCHVLCRLAKCRALALCWF